METLMSPVSEYATVPCSASKPDKTPTYTTVGSIYNPQATTPLQPPTRRGRVLRFAPPFQSSISNDHGVDLPLSLLAALPIAESTARSSPTARKIAPQYSPLQQNFDRAVNPMADWKGDGLASKGPLAPSMKSGNLIYPPGLGPAPTPVAGTHPAHPEDDDDEDSSLSDDTLASRFNVKGLTNLASFPNPMQRLAQKALAKGRCANGNRLVTPPPLLHASSELAAEQDTALASLRTAESDSGSFSSLHNDSINRVESGRASKLNGNGMLGTRHGRLGYGLGGSSFSKLSTGPGAPEPLKAGPPGQRQYKPSTFETTIKALQGPGQTIGSHSTVVEDEHRVLKAPSLSTPNTSFQLAVSHGRPTSTRQSATSSSDLPAMEHVPVSTLDSEPKKPLPLRCHRISDTMSLEDVQKYYPRGYPADHSGLQLPVWAGWLDEYPLNRARQWMTPSQLAKRQAKIDQDFYGGAANLEKKVEQSHLQHREQLFNENVGVFGGEREPHMVGGYPSQMTITAGIGKYPLSIEEVNHTDTAQHAEPLLNMALATLLNLAKEVNTVVEAEV